MADPLRIVQVGAGSMGEAWVDALGADSDVELVGLVDLDEARARAVAVASGRRDLTVGSDLSRVLSATRPDAVVNVTVPVAHRSTTETALAHSVPVLCEKPIAGTVPDAWAMVAAAERSGQLLMISQSRRYGPGVAAFRRLMPEVGRIGTVACQFFRAPRFGGFREEMAQPLLVDMAIHHFDLARLLAGTDPVEVSCRSYNPAWSWYAGDAAADATFTFADGVRFAYTGSWCAPGAETSWNGTWRVSGARGTAVWDGDHPPSAERADRTRPTTQVGAEPLEIAGSLAEFVRCLRTGSEPDTAARRNIVSLAMVEAAVRSAGEGRTVTIAEILGDGGGAP